MSELGPESFFGSMDKNEAEEEHVRLALEKAVQAGYLTEQDVAECFGVDAQDILIGIASYIEMSGDDAEVVMKEWGLVDAGEEYEV